MRLLFLSCFLSVSLFTNAQFLGRTFFLSSAVTVGYTFGARINFGYQVDLGVEKKFNDNMFMKYGLSFSNYFVKTGKHTHRLRALSIMGSINFLDARVGIGRVKNRWGYGNKNRCVTRGINLDLTAGMANNNMPWIGFREFIYPPANWAWFNRNYSSVYLKYSYNVFPVKMVSPTTD